MRREFTRRVWILVSLVFFAGPQGLSSQEDPGTYEVGKALPPEVEGRPTVPMTLEDAMDLALTQNLDIRSARLAPRIQEYGLAAAEAVFDPTISSTLSYNNSSTQSTSQLDGGQRIETERAAYNASIAQTLPWYGGRLSADFNNGRTESTNSFSVLNPNYNSNLSLNYTQPLLAGLKTDNQRAGVRTQRLQGEISEIQLTARTENIRSQVRVAYWALRASIDQIEIQRQNLAQARELLEQNRIRVRLGSMSELQVIQAEAQVANAEQALLNAEVQWRNQELVFKSLLVSGPGDPLFQQTVNPTELPAVTAPEVDLPAAVERAMEERTDLRQQRRQRQITEVELAVTRNSTLPDLNLTAGYSLRGVGGDRYERSGLGGEAILIEEGGYGDALDSLWDRDTPTWNLSLNFSYPIGNAASRANLERARLQMEQTDLALQAQELAVVTQVTDAGLAVRDTYLQFQAAQRSREVAERSAEIELTRFRVGAATNYEVMLAQNGVTSARLSELRALINHANAVAEFQRVQRIGG